MHDMLYSKVFIIIMHGNFSSIVKFNKCKQEFII